MAAQLLAQGIEARGSSDLSRVELQSMSGHLLVAGALPGHRAGNDAPPRLQALIVRT